MITHQNIYEVLKQLPEKELVRLTKGAEKYEYCAIYLHVFNSGSFTTMKLTNNYSRYRNISYRGDALLYCSEAINILEQGDSES